MQSTAHYFIALLLPSNVKDMLADQQAYFKKQMPYKQWTYREDFHITVKFLGAVSQEKMKLLLAELEVIKQSDPFSITIKGTGTFGKEAQPRVLWARVETSESLENLYQNVEVAVEQAGFTKESRPFRPHITLGKKWAGPPLSTVQQLVTSYHTAIHAHVHVQEIVIYKIHPLKQPKYEVMHRFNLNGGV
ncbi:RNA 2',3'-cyclic phosphodiesterase [Virgibacillus sp. LDC-1]|uniref:RNA 2',3'-cyclic phosphodiesterase n=1 Tax=Virgibacillus sp. LDC-1 TaxID=3039856 RepID=UPI0024DE4AE5|nr:RNA 2',3'-cyclic phosphodiesterase [Virgibacillus sp. LDC-1]